MGILHHTPAVDEKVCCMYCLLFCHSLNTIACGHSNAMKQCKFQNIFALLYSRGRLCIFIFKFFCALPPPAFHIKAKLHYIFCCTANQALARPHHIATSEHCWDVVMWSCQNLICCRALSMLYSKSVPGVASNWFAVACLGLLLFFFQSVLHWSIAVSTICRHSTARSQVWLGLSAGRFQSGATCRIHAAGS